MADAITHIIAGKPVSDELLSRFFRGDLQPGEMSRLEQLIQSDELYREVYGVISHEEFLSCISINQNVCKKINASYPLSGGWKYYHYLGIAAVIALLLAWWMWPAEADSDKHPPATGKNSVAPAGNENKNASEISHWTPYTNSWHEEDGTEKAKENESALEHVEPGNIDDIYKSIPENVTEETAQQKLTGKENKNPDNKNNIVYQGDNTRKFDENAIISLDVAAAQVVIKNNLAEMDNTQTDPNHKVNDPNIGNAVVTKGRDLKYNIADMPYYDGGDLVLNVYVESHLDQKISIRRKQFVESVLVKFDLTAKGKIENVEVMGIDVPENMKKEIEKVIKEAPGWRAGKKSGRKGSMQYTIAISFSY